MGHEASMRMKNLFKGLTMTFLAFVGKEYSYILK